MAFCKNCGTHLNEQGTCPNCAEKQQQEPVMAGAASQPPVNEQPQAAPNMNSNIPPQQPNTGYQQQPNYQQPPQQNFNQQGQYNQNQGYQQAPPPQGASFTDKVKNFIFNTKDETANINPNDVNDAKTISLFSYLGFLFFIPIVVKPMSRYARFHSNQGLILLITDVICSIVSGILNSIFLATMGTSYYLFREPSVLSILFSTIFSIIIWVPMAGLIVLGIYNAVTGKAKELPLIGRFRILKDLPQSY